MWMSPTVISGSTPIYFSVCILSLGITFSVKTETQNKPKTIMKKLIIEKYCATFLPFFTLVVLQEKKLNKQLNKSTCVFYVLFGIVLFPYTLL